MQSVIIESEGGEPGKIYVGEEALKKEILKAQEEKEKKEKPNGK